MLGLELIFLVAQEVAVAHCIHHASTCLMVSCLCIGRVQTGRTLRMSMQRPTHGQAFPTGQQAACQRQGFPLSLPIRAPLRHQRQSSQPLWSRPLFLMSCCPCRMTRTLAELSASVSCGPRRLDRCAVALQLHHMPFLALQGSSVCQT